MAEFLSTEHGAAICPFFTWQSERHLVDGNHLNNISLVHCIHPANPDDFEGNCQEEYCPLLKEAKQ